MKNENNGKLNKKQIFISVFTFVFIFICYGLFLFYTNNKSDAVKITKQMKANKKYDILDVTDIKSTKNKKNYELSFVLNNNTSKDFEKSRVFLVVLDKKGDVEYKEAFLINKIPAKEKAIFGFILSKKVLSSYNFLISSN